MPSCSTREHFVTVNNGALRPAMSLFEYERGCREAGIIAALEDERRPRGRLRVVPRDGA